MADIAVTANQVECIDPSKAEIYEFVAGPTGGVGVGDTVSVDANGFIVLADADGAGTLKEIKGLVIAMNGRAASVLKRGRVAGLTLTGAYGSRIYPSATAGRLADTITGTVAAVGQVVPMSDSLATKVAYLEFSWATAYA